MRKANIGMIWFSDLRVSKRGMLSIGDKLDMFSRDKVHNIYIFCIPEAVRVLRDNFFAGTLLLLDFQ